MGEYTINGTYRLSAKDVAEFERKAYIGEEEWNKLKQELDGLLMERKVFNGKPDEYDRARLMMDKSYINFLKYLLWGNHGGSNHSADKRD